MFDAKARAWTLQHATQRSDGAEASGAAAAGPSEARDALGLGEDLSGEAPSGEECGGGEVPAAAGAGADGKVNGGEGAAGKAAGEGPAAKLGRPPLSASQDAPDAKRAKVSLSAPRQDS